MSNQKNSNVLDEQLRNFNMTTSARIILEESHPLHNRFLCSAVYKALLYPYTEGNVRRKKVRIEPDKDLSEIDNALISYLSNELTRLLRETPVLKQIDSTLGIRSAEWAALIAGHIGLNAESRLELRFLTNPGLVTKIMLADHSGVVRLNEGLVFPLNKVILRSKLLPCGKASIIEVWRYSFFNNTFRLPRKGANAYTDKLTAPYAMLSSPHLTKAERDQLKDRGQLDVT